jgi:hypothetical protein
MRPPGKDKDLVILKFDLANANVQSIGHAQAKYVTALLTYMGVLLGLSLFGSGRNGARAKGVHGPPTLRYDPSLAPFETQRRQGRRLGHPLGAKSRSLALRHSG